MKKLLFFLAFLIAAVAIPSMAAAQPGGLINGKVFLDTAGKRYENITDSQESTYDVIKYSTTISYVSDVTMNIDSIYFNSDYLGLVVGFYNESGTRIYSATTGYTSTPNGQLYNGVLKKLDATIKDVKKIAISNSDGNQHKIFEMDVFGTLNVPRPINVTVTPGIKNLTVSFPSVDGAIGYWIYIDDVKTTRIASTNYVIGNLTPDKSYTIRVSAIHSGDNESYLSDPVTKTVMSEPQNPNLKAVPAWNQVSLSWDDIPNSRSVSIYRDGSRITTISDNKYVSYEDKYVNQDTTYTYYLEFIDRYGRTLRSDEVKVKTPTKPQNTKPPESPKSLKAAMSTNMKNIDLSWIRNAEDDIAGYNLYASEDGQKYNVIAEKTKNISFTYPDVKSEQKYYFRLEAVNESKLVSEPAYTSITVPKRTTDSDQQETNEYLLVTWEKTEGATGYVIYLNGRKVGSVGANVFSFKITKDMGYIPGALINRTEVKALYADGSTGDGSGNSGGGSGGGGGGGGGPLEDALSFIGVADMIGVAIDFLSLYKLWIILILAVIVSPVLYGLIVKVVQYVNRRYAISDMKRR